MINQFLFLFVSALIFGRALWLSRSGRVIPALVSSLTAAVYVSCLWIPANLQSAGLIVSKIERAGIARLPASDEVAALALAWTIELLVVLAAELACGFFVRGSRRQSSQRIGLRTLSSLDARRAVIFMLIAGAAAIILFPAPAAENRADGGQGFTVVLRSFLVVGLAMLAFYNFFRRNSFRLVALSGILFLIIGSVRSPLLVVLFGYVAGLVARRELRPPRILLLVGLAAVLAIFAAFMSNVRGAAIRGERMDLQEVIVQTLESPYASAYEAGIDTLDGYRLSARIQPLEEPRPFSVLTVFTNFVPRAIWPNKPNDITVDISAKYLNYGAGGQFLSPIGFMRIAFGGWGYALVGMFVIVFLLSWAARYFRNSFVLAIVICANVRFMMGGAPFDLYYALTLTIPVIVSVSAIRLLKSLNHAARRDVARAYHRVAARTSGGR